MFDPNRVAQAVVKRLVVTGLAAPQVQGRVHMVVEEELRKAWQEHCRGPELANETQAASR